MANVKATDLIDFTRASKGHALAKVSYGSELVENGTFDSDISGWTDSLSTSTWDSDGYISVSYFTSASGPYQSFSTEVGKIYAVSGTLISTTGTGASGPLIRAGSGSSPNAGIIDSNTLSAGETATISFVATSTTSYVYLRNASAYTSKWDNISVKEVTFDQPDGTLQLFEHPEGTPRIEYDADGNLLGLLIEESRTNLLTYSEDFSQSAWIKTNVNVTAADYGYKITEDSSNGVHRIYDLLTVSNSTNYSFSVYVKSAERTKAFIRFGGQNNVYAVVDLENGTVVEGSLTPTITEAFDGFYKISVTHTTISTTFAPNIGPVADNYTVTNGEPRYQGDGTSGIIVYGAQLEEASFPTSYIKTTGSTATRSADVASIPVSDFGYNQNEGTFFINITDVISNGNKDYFSVSSSGSFNPASFGLYGTPNTGSTLGYRRRNSAYDPAITSATDIQSTGSKVALSHDTSSLVISVDGVATETSSSNSIDTITEIAFGGSGHGVTGDVHSKHIKSIKYIPKRLSNAKLQELTS